MGYLILYHNGIIMSRRLLKKYNMGNLRVMRLKQLRKERKISQLKLALDLNMNQNTVSRYESDTRHADYAALIAIADYFDVSVDYILRRTDNLKTNR